MLITAHTLAAVAGASLNDNMVSTAVGLQMAGVGAGLERPHRLAMFLGQLSHESMGWRYDREIWGPTAAQKRYEGRKDLGNTQPGDGSRFRGRGPVQLTGRYNYTRFTNWARQMSASAPDFTANPEAVNSDPWEGLSPIWYWEAGNPTGANLNRYADAGDFETVTRRINGGLNGYADRQARYARAALVLMGRNPEDLRGYQKALGLAADGISGPRTVASLHKTLASMPAVRFSETAARPAPKPSTTKSQGGIVAVIVAIGAMIAAYLGFK